ncbi:MAG: hypothetical protein U1E62_25120 [Alsobacter sp.]
MSRLHLAWVLSFASVALLPAASRAASPVHVPEICRKEAVAATRSVRPIGRRHALLDSYVRRCVARPSRAQQSAENQG